MDKELVRHIAGLSNIALSSQEEEIYAKEFEKILEYMSKIQEVSRLKEAKITREQNKIRLREDEVKPQSISIEKLSSYIEDNQFKVPRVIE